MNYRRQTSATWAWNTVTRWSSGHPWALTTASVWASGRGEEGTRAGGAQEWARSSPGAAVEEMQRGHLLLPSSKLHGTPNSSPRTAVRIGLTKFPGTHAPARGLVASGPACMEGTWGCLRVSSAHGHAYGGSGRPRGTMCRPQADGSRLLRKTRGRRMDAQKAEPEVGNGGGEGWGGPCQLGGGALH